MRLCLCLAVAAAARLVFALPQEDAAAETLKWLPARDQPSCNISNGIAVNFGKVKASAVWSQSITSGQTVKIGCYCPECRHRGYRLHYCFGITGANMSNGYRSLSHQGTPPAELPFVLYGPGKRIVGSPDGTAPAAPAYGSKDFKEAAWSDTLNIPYDAKLSADGRFGYNIPKGSYQAVQRAELHYGLTRDTAYWSEDSSCRNLDWPTAPATGNAVFTAEAESACSLQTADNVVFDKSYDLSRALTATGAITAQCSAGTAYQIGIGPSRNSPNDSSRRAMRRNDGTELIYYNLYKDYAHTHPWGAAWGNDSSVLKYTAASGALKSHTVFAQTEPNQKTPPPGLYQDTVTVELRVE